MDQHRAEVQGVDEHDSVLIYCGEGRRVQVESTGTDITLSIDFGSTPRKIPVYDRYGEEIAELAPKP
jgi:hypothetical protein